jgi:serine/threonine-protein kinase
LTEQGTLLGTLQYMAPEQVEGKVDEIDGRTDSFAFGAVVYEMATRKKAFDGQTQASVISKILQVDPPPISSLEPPGKLSPPALDRVVKRCLAKDRNERWQTAYDLWQDVKWIKEGGGQAGAVPEAKPAAKTWKRRLAFSVAGLLAWAVTALVIWSIRPAPPPQPVSRFTITLPAGDRLAALTNPAVAISPDGSRLVYAAIRGGAQQLYVRDIGALEAKPLSGTESGSAPFFSPDGQWVGFYAGGSLKKISITGGAPVTLCLATGGFVVGAAWGTDGTIVFHYLNVGGLWQVADAGGMPKQLTTPDSKKGELIHRWPQVLPGGKAVLFAASATNSNFNGAQVAVGVLGSGERRDLGWGGSRPAYAASGQQTLLSLGVGGQGGHLVYAQGGTLMAAPFDPRRLAVGGTPVPVQEGVLQSLYSGVAQYSFSSNGSLVYVPGGIQGGQSTLAWVDRKGAEQPLKAAAHAYRNPRVSPDGRRVAVEIDEQSSQVWTYDLSRETLTRLTFQGSYNGIPEWTPDGKRIAFQSNIGGPLNLFWQPSDGSGGPERLTSGEVSNPSPNSFSPDGQLLAFSDNNTTTSRDIWVLRLSDPGAPASAPAGPGGQGRKAQPFLRTPYEELASRFSPDGKWLAYTSDESGHREVYVQPYPGPGGKWQISTDGGHEAVWNPNGRELFYRSGSRIMAVDVNQSRDREGAGAGPSAFSAGRPRMLFEGPYLPTAANSAYYDVSPDGQRFLMLKPVETPASAPTQINVVLNWFEELKKRVPAGQ